MYKIRATAFTLTAIYSLSFQIQVSEFNTAIQHIKTIMKNDNPENISTHAPIILSKTSKTFPLEKGVIDSNNSINNITLSDDDIAGKHYIVDFYGASHLTDITLIEKALFDASHIAGATLLHIHLHTFTGGGGVTGVALLAESHISVHTWPERDYAAFDVFMCGNSQPEKAINLLKEVFQPTRIETQEILRGKP